MPITTKEKIKQNALFLFARQGYYGTSISDIVNEVKIKKASFYSHYAGKDELFLIVAEDVMRCHGDLFANLLEETKHLDLPNKLQHHFKGYIKYFIQNPQLHFFSNQSLFHIPPELKDKIRSAYLDRERPYRQKLVDIITDGMQQGLIVKGNPETKYWSFKTKRDGVLGWISASPDLHEECIKELWRDFWLGVATRN